MRGVTVSSMVALLALTACLVGQTSKEKKLTKVVGDSLSDEQQRANNKLALKNAEKIIENACGSVLHDPIWTETSPVGDGFLTYRTKHKDKIGFGEKTSCSVQLVTIDLQAALDMGKHNLSCSLDHKNLLRFNVPGNRGHADAIKVDCETRLVHVSLADDKLQLATFEENGSTYLAKLDDQGNIDGSVTALIDGVSDEELAKLKETINNAEDKSLNGLLDKAGAGALIGVGAGTISAGGGSFAAAIAGTTLLGVVGLGIAIAVAVMGYNESKAKAAAGRAPAGWAPAPAGWAPAPVQGAELREAILLLGELLEDAKRQQQGSQ